jgi:hypothetical protein
MIVHDGRFHVKFCDPVTDPCNQVKLTSVSYYESALHLCYNGFEACFHLTLDKTLDETAVLQSPLLPGFHCQVGQMFTSFLR